jgi:hypothetical protein
MMVSSPTLKINSTTAKRNLNKENLHWYRHMNQVQYSQSTGSAGMMRPSLLDTSRVRSSQAKDDEDCSRCEIADNLALPAQSARPAKENVALKVAAVSSGIIVQNSQSRSKPWGIN